MSEQIKPDVMGCEPCIAQIRALAQGIGAITEKPIYDINDEHISSLAQLALLIEENIGKIAVKLGFEE